MRVGFKLVFSLVIYVAVIFFLCLKLEFAMTNNVEKYHPRKNKEAQWLKSTDEDGAYLPTRAGHK